MQITMYLAGSVVSVLLGCAASHQVVSLVRLPETATVLLDSDLTPEEAGRVTVGLDSWQARLSSSNLEIRYGRVNHYEAITSTAPSDWIFIIREPRAADLDEPCKLSGKVGCWAHWNRHIYIAVDDLSHDALSAVAAHELGHALGLNHCETEASVMAPDVGHMSPQPTAADVRQFCQTHSCVF